MGLNRAATVIRDGQILETKLRAAAAISSAYYGRRLAVVWQ